MGLTLAILVGIAAALHHPIPRIYKKTADKLVKPTGVYWSLVPAGGSDVAGVTPSPLSVSQAKQIADVLKAPIFQGGSAGSLSFIFNKPASNADTVDASGQSFYERL
jgi:hypothetical protein